MKIQNLNLLKAQEKGWNEWHKYNKNRLYFSIKSSEMLDLDFYKSGAISFSELNGEKISHAEASRLVASKVFIDLDTNELHVDSDADEDLLKEILDAEIAKIVEVEEEVEEAEEETETLEVEVEETVEGITGNVLDMELSGNNGSDVDHLSDLFDDAVLSEKDYDKLTDIWNQHSTIVGILNALEKADLIEDYEIKKGGAL